MSTVVTVVVAKPNHCPVQVFYTDEQKTLAGTSLLLPFERVVSVGEAATFMLYKGRRLCIEELPE